MKKYKDINSETLTKSEKRAVVVVTKFDDASLHAMKYAVDLFGLDARYILLCIYSFKDAISVDSIMPDVVRAEMMGKLSMESRAVRTMLGDLQPEIALRFEFGNDMMVLKDGWEKAEFDVAVVPNERKWALRMKLLPSMGMPIHVAPKQLDLLVAH